MFKRREWSQITQYIGVLFIIWIIQVQQLHAQNWYSRIQMRGYMQVRYNRLFETNPLLKCEQCDRSWGENGGFFLRRGRIALSANLHPRLQVYIQPDFGSQASSTSLNFMQIRDAYMDIAIDSMREFTIRIGQSKVPYGFENMQSSQVRITLDRSDALNSAISNERDLGVMLYYTPKKVQDLYGFLQKNGLKPYGNYGIVGLGIFNGQIANRPELNNSLHTILKVNYPFTWQTQILELGAQLYYGKVVVGVSSPEVKKSAEYVDSRIALSAYLYPQPFGLQAEWNFGQGPEYDHVTQSILEKPLQGGYVQLFYNIKKGKQLFFPYTRFQYFEGGKKHELDSRSYSVREIETGVEWNPYSSLEIILQYTYSRRRFEDFVKPHNTQFGGLMRIQTQVSF